MNFLNFKAFIEMFNFMIDDLGRHNDLQRLIRQAVSGRYHGIIETQVLLRLEVSHKIFES